MVHGGVRGSQGLKPGAESRTDSRAGLILLG